MGSKKYPDENEFDTFVTKHGGYTNAHTDMEDVSELVARCCARSLVWRLSVNLPHIAVCTPLFEYGTAFVCVWAALTISCVPHPHPRLLPCFVRSRLASFSTSSVHFFVRQWICLPSFSSPHFSKKNAWYALHGTLHASPLVPCFAGPCCRVMFSIVGALTDPVSRRDVFFFFSRSMLLL